MGQVVFSFIPLVADARDFIANVFVNGDGWAALANAGGFVLDVVPGAGATGDGIKAAGKVGDFIVKFAGDAAKVGEALRQAAKHFPKIQEMMPLLGKIIPSSTLDNMSYAIAQGTPITKAEFEAIQELGEAAGKKMDDVGPWYSRVGDKVVESGGKINPWDIYTKQIRDNSINVTGWNKGSFDSVEESVARHYYIHADEVGASNVEQSIRKAEGFKLNLKGATKSNVSGAVDGVVRYKKNGKYIDLAPDGTIISFGAT